MEMSVTFAGAGSASPNHVVTNDYFRHLGLTDRWIYSRTGIRQRHWLLPEEKLADLAFAASEAALADAGLPAEQIDLVIAATLTHDSISPGLAVQLAAMLGAPGPAAIDVNGACSGFLYALDYAISKVGTGHAKCALVCGADANSRILDRNDPATAPLFGDGAGAIAVTYDPVDCPHGCRPATYLRSDGRLRDLLFIERADGVLRMKGVEVYQLAIEAMSDSVKEVCALSDTDIGEIDFLVAHQANARIIRQVALELGIEPARAALYLEDMGNTSAASMPASLARAQSEGRISAGSRIVLTAFGAGMTWGAARIDWRTCRHRLGEAHVRQALT